MGTVREAVGMGSSGYMVGIGTLGDTCEVGVGVSERSSICGREP